jgi:hypothetical protein
VKVNPAALLDAFGRLDCEAGLPSPESLYGRVELAVE